MRKLPKRIDQDDPFFSEESDREKIFAEPFFNEEDIKPMTSDKINPYKTDGRKPLEDR